MKIRVDGRDVLYWYRFGTKVIKIMSKSIKNQSRLYKIWLFITIFSYKQQTAFSFSVLYGNVSISIASYLN